MKISCVHVVQLKFKRSTKIVARFEYARVREKISNKLGAKLELSIRKTEF